MVCTHSVREAVTSHAAYLVGASVIYADTVADLGYADELGNYAEYSGAPNLQVCSKHSQDS